MGLHFQLVEVKMATEKTREIFDSLTQQDMQFLLLIAEMKGSDGHVVENIRAEIFSALSGDLAREVARCIMDLRKSPELKEAAKFFLEWASDRRKGAERPATKVSQYNQRDALDYKPLSKEAQDWVDTWGFN